VSTKASGTCAFRVIMVLFYSISINALLTIFGSIFNIFPKFEKNECSSQGAQMLNPEIGKFFSKIGKNREIFCQKSGSFNKWKKFRKITAKLALCNKSTLHNPKTTIIQQSKSVFIFRISFGFL
jgi:hypothetical protein